MPVFFFTDIESSTRLWEEHTDEMGEDPATGATEVQGQVGGAVCPIAVPTATGTTCTLDRHLSRPPEVAARL